MDFICKRNVFVISFLLLSLTFLLPAKHSLADQGNVEKVLAAAKEAGLSEAEINRILAYGYHVRISTENAVELLEILTNARSQGFVIDPLLEKIDEGLAKHVSFEVIKAVLRKKIRDYEYVLSLYRDNNPDTKDMYPFIQRTADSIDLGLEYEELRLLFDSISDTPAQMFEVAAINMAFLKQLNFNPNLSMKIMHTGLKYKSLEPDWENFFKVAASERKKGISEEAISETAIKILQKNQSLKDFIRVIGQMAKNDG